MHRWRTSSKALYQPNGRKLDSRFGGNFEMTIDLYKTFYSRRDCPAKHRIITDDSIKYFRGDVRLSHNPPAPVNQPLPIQWLVTDSQDRTFNGRLQAIRPSDIVCGLSWKHYSRSHEDLTILFGQFISTAALYGLFTKSTSFGSQFIVQKPV